MKISMVASDWHPKNEWDGMGWDSKDKLEQRKTDPNMPWIESL